MTDRRGFALPALSVDMKQISENLSFFTSLGSHLGDVAFLLYFLVLALFTFLRMTGLTFIFIITCPPFIFYQYRQAVTLIILLL